MTLRLWIKVGELSVADLEALKVHIATDLLRRYGIQRVDFQQE